MLSFTTIATIATLAFSAATSALPAYRPAFDFSPKYSSEHHPVYGNDVHPPPPAPHYHPLDGPAYHSPPYPRADYQHPTTVSIPDILNDLNTQVVPLCNDFNHRVKATGDAKAAVQVSIQVLTEIKALVAAAQNQVQAAVYANVDGILYLNGKPITVHAIAQIIADLVIAITTVFGVIIEVFVKADIQSILPLVMEIGTCVAGIITAILKVSGNILVELKPLVQHCFGTIVELKLQDLISCLQIPV